MAAPAQDVAQHALTSLVTAISAGTFLMAIAQRIGVPAIVLLLTGGVLLGPEVLGFIQPDSMGSLLMPLVSLAVGLILFEAGLTLDFHGYKTASTVIQRLLSVGTLITWGGTTAAIYFIIGVPVELALLAASLVIVTGPTVILPLLKRIRVIPRVHHILQWEGVLIDPIGVFVAILCFEFLTSGSGWNAAMDFGLRMFVGITVGFFGGGLTYYILKKRLAPEHLVGVVTLGCAAFTFGVSEVLIGESGLLSTIVAGFVPAILRPVDIKRVTEFKAEVADLLIAVIFMVLASRLRFEQFLEFGWHGWLVVGVVMLVVRPVNVLVCTFGQGLNWREKAFLSWLAPRGIVAASMASLFRIMLEENGMFENPEFVETFTYSVIFSTIIIEGLSANRIAILLRLKRPEPNGWLIVGAHEFGRRIATFFAQSGLPVAVVDSNPRQIRALAARTDVTALQVDARDPALFEHEALMNMGHVLALTDNEDLNLVISARLATVVGRGNTYAWVSANNQQALEVERAQAIWTNLPKPSLLSAELRSFESRVFQLDGAMSAPADSTILATVRENAVQMITEPPSGPPGEGVKQIIVVRSSNHLKRSLALEHTLDYTGTSLQGALEAALDHLMAQHPTLPKQDIVREVTAREREFPTVLGHGVAVPHTYTRHLKQRLCFIIFSKDGVPFGPPDAAELVHLIFFVISPAGDPEGHLAIMAQIAHLISDTDMRERLLAATTAVEIYSIAAEEQ